MTDLEHGELRVVVPVGLLLQEEREVSVYVERADGSPLPIRLRLVPARPYAGEMDEPAAVPFGWHGQDLTESDGDGYPEPDYGGGD